MVDIVDLKNFLVLCETRSFSRAAERCNVSTSGLSRRIGGLEQWIGTALFDRSRSALELTDAGSRLLGVASQAVYSLEGVRKYIKDSTIDHDLRVRLAGPHITSSIFFSTWIPKLSKHFQNAKFRVTSDHLQECLQMLEENEVDFVVSLFDDAKAVQQHLNLLDFADRYLGLILGDERMIAVSAPDNNGNPKFSLDNLEQPISFLNYDKRCSLGWALEQALRGQQITRFLVEYHQHNLSNGVRNLAISGLGVAWLPETLIQEDISRGTLVRASSSSHDIPMKVVIFKKTSLLSGQANALWTYLSNNNITL